MTFDVVIRGGTVVDGTGGPGRVIDVGIEDDRIVALGESLPPGKKEIDAHGLLVTPGFIDVHAHLDGNVTWEAELKPASGHGTTSAVMGNCGVGFAPCREEDRPFNVALMEGVEDIPAAQLNEGLPWNWESYPEYLEFLSHRRFDMNVAGLMPHSCLRVYVMGQRAIDGETANTTDLEQMETLVAEAVAAGAVGVGSTRLVGQKTLSGTPAPSIAASEEEYLAIARGLGDKGILQIAPEFNQFPRAEEELDMIIRVARETGCRMTYSLKQTNGHADGWRSLLEKTQAANESGLVIRPQVLARPTGAIMSWEANVHPFSRCPSYREVAGLPIDERAEALRDPDRRKSIIAEAEATPGGYARYFSRMFPARETINYEPDESQSILAEAERTGMSFQALLYDLFMDHNGRGVILLASGNYAEFTLDPMLEMIGYEHSLPGLGDAGAHSTVICDASATTHLLSYWTKERAGERLAVEKVVHKLTQLPAEFFGFSGRGVLEEGAIADINVIDHDRLALGLPCMEYNLPANGRRLVQPAKGYRATLVGGQLIRENDVATGVLSGRLL